MKMRGPISGLLITQLCLIAVRISRRYLVRMHGDHVLRELFYKCSSRESEPYCSSHGLHKLSLKFRKVCEHIRSEVEPKPFVKLQLPILFDLYGLRCGCCGLCDCLSIAVCGFSVLAELFAYSDDSIYCCCGRYFDLFFVR